MLRQLLSSFSKDLDSMTVEEKRAAIRSVVRKAIWDGKQIHLILFGASADEIDPSGFPRPTIDSGSGGLPPLGEDSK